MACGINIIAILRTKKSSPAKIETFILTNDVAAQRIGVYDLFPDMSEIENDKNLGIQIDIDTFMHLDPNNYLAVDKLDGSTRLMLSEILSALHEFMANGYDIELFAELA